MARTDHDVRRRLQLAAVELFGEKGYERTTAAEIAARGGVTERTFFRYFTDKREVLFDGEAILRVALTEALDDVPPRMAPLDALFAAFQAITPLLEGNRPYALPRQRLIAATPALAERELAKQAALAGVLASALKLRGAQEQEADLAAQVGMMAFAYATIAWLEQPDIELHDRLRLAREKLRAILS